eukprot:4208611-Prymnesium_polylepis.1
MTPYSSHAVDASTYPRAPLARMTSIVYWVAFSPYATLCMAFASATVGANALYCSMAEMPPAAKISSALFLDAMDKPSLAVSSRSNDL